MNVWKIINYVDNYVVIYVVIYVVGGSGNRPIYE